MRVNARVAATHPDDTVSAQGITKPALGRVARRAGVKQVSRPVYEEARAALNAFLTKIVQDCTLYAEHGHRKTIVASDVEMALNRNGRPMYGFRVD